MRTGIRNNDYESKGEKKIENTIELIQATSFRHLKCVSRDSISSPQAAPCSCTMIYEHIAIQMISHRGGGMKITGKQVGSEF